MAVVKEGKRSQITVYPKANLLARFKALCEERDEKMSWRVCQLIRRWVEEQEKSSPTYGHK